jgi:glutathione S-transferase
MTQNSMKLYIDKYWISPYAMYAYVALKEKGLGFDVEELFLDKKEQRQEPFKSISMTGKIPCLRDGSMALTESLAIVDYLEEKYAFPNYPRILPANIDDRARARQIMDWMGSDFAALRRERSTFTVFYMHTQKPLSVEACYDVERLVDFARIFLVAGQKNLFGEWSITDTVFSMMLSRLVENGDPMPEFVREYVRRLWERPSVREYITHKRPPGQPYD